MRGRTVRRVVALLSTIACCCIAMPAPVRAATDDAKPPSKSSKSTAKPSTSSKSSSKSSKSSKPSSKSSSTKSKSSSKSSSAKKSSKATASTKKATPAPAKPPPTSDAVRAAFDPAAPSATGIPGAPSATASATPPGQRGPTRIDFDDRLIQGQRNTAGAVYLYDRKELKQRSMIKKRESFREEIVGVVYDSEL
jgi:cobalamin biosynthesis Mg chelatase CobN